MKWLLSVLVKPPAMLLNRLRFTRKLLLMALVTGVPMLLICGLLVELLSADISIGESEARGIVALKPLIDLQNAVQTHRGAMAVQFARSTLMPAMVSESGAGADAALAVLDQWNAGEGQGLGPDLQWRIIKKGWAGLKARGADDSADQNFSDHTALVERIIAYTADVAAASSLTLDPEMSSHALVEFTTEKVPAALEAIGLLRNYAAAHFSPGATPAPSALMRLLTYDSAAHAAFVPLIACLQRALDTDGPAVESLSSQLKAAVAAEDGLRTAIDDKITQPDIVAGSVGELFAQGTAAKNALVHVDGNAIAELNRLVHARIRHARHQRLLAAGACVAALSIGFYLFLGFMDSFATALYRLHGAAMQITRNEFPEQIDLYSADEMQDIADQMTKISYAFRQYSEGQRRQLAEAVRRDAELQRLTESLQRTLALQTAILDSSSLGIIATNQGGVVVSFNRAAQRMLGYSEAEVVGWRTLDRFHDRDELVARAQKLSEELGRTVSVGVETLTAKASASLDGIDEQEWTYLRKDGSRFPVLLPVTATRDPSGALTGFLGVAQDISERKQRDLLMARSLKEKETLLKEVYHRVKNNLQVITSLFDLQLRNLPEGPAYSALRDGADRVSAMALVHEKLYQSGTLSSISARTYVEELCERLAEAASTRRRGIELVARVDAVELSMDTAVPLGLWLNEVISNSLKHGFPNGRSGTIRIGLAHDAGTGIVVTVDDDGVGIPSDAPRKTKSLGMKLVASLSEQLDGTYSMETTGGVRVRLCFPLPQV